MPEFLNPEEVLNQLEINPNINAADFGCGSGGWVIPLARKAENGKVYALDILDEPLSSLRSKIKLEKIFNIEARKADVEKNSYLNSNSCDLVLMTNLLFEAEDRKKVLEEGKRVLKPQGRILVVDWEEGVKFGPENKVSKQEIKKIAEEIGLKTIKEFSAGSYHYGLILLKE